jgi:hypothetical protein
MRTPQSAYEEAMSCLNTRILKAEDSIVPCKESYKLGLNVAIGQLKMSFHGVFPEAQSPPPNEPQPEALASTQPPHSEAEPIAKSQIDSIPFGPHLTCSQCGARCTDHHMVFDTVWCPKCANEWMAPIEADAIPDFFHESEGPAAPCEEHDCPSKQ